MLLLLQNVLYCILFILPVKLAAKNDGMNCLYFYPKAYIEEAQRRGLADKEATMKRGKRFMVPFCIYIFAALILIAVESGYRFQNRILAGISVPGGYELV